jgi:hypothetical protein
LTHSPLTLAGFTNDLYRVPIPRARPWPPARDLRSALVESFYDWDFSLLPAAAFPGGGGGGGDYDEEKVTAQGGWLTSRLVLCTGGLPCFLFLAAVPDAAAGRRATGSPQDLRASPWTPSSEYGAAAHLHAQRAGRGGAAATAGAVATTTLWRAAGAGIDCLARHGCAGVALRGIAVADAACPAAVSITNAVPQSPANGAASSAKSSHGAGGGPAVELEGANLDVHGGGFYGCAGDGSGGSGGGGGGGGGVLAYAGATVDIVGAVFRGLSSAGAGSAILAAGSLVRLRTCSFVGCAAGAGGGGALAAGPFRAFRAARRDSDVAVEESRWARARVHKILCAQVRTKIMEMRSIYGLHD